MKTLLLCALLAAPLTHAALQVVEAPHPHVTPDTEIAVIIQNLPEPNNAITSTATRADSNDPGSFGGFTGTYFFRSSDTPTDPGSSTATPSFEYYFKDGDGETYNAGGQPGDDNWIYLTGNTSTKAWAQVNIDTTSITVLRYVYDPTNPIAHFNLPAAIAAVNGPTSTDRDIQIRSVDFSTRVLELKNFGPSSIDLDGWQFCSHDSNQFRQYSNSGGLNGESIDSGASLFIHFDNDAPGGDSTHINLSSIGGNFALPLTNNSYAIGLYINSNFGSGASMADYAQWSRGGEDNTLTDERAGEAQSGGVWTDQSSWIVTSAATEQIILTDTKNGILHGPNDYLRQPDFQITSIEYNPPSGDFIIHFPTINNLVVDVQKATNIATGTWSTLFSTSGDTAFVIDQFDPSAYYRIAPKIP